MTNNAKKGGSDLVLAEIAATNWPPASVLRVNDPYFKWSKSIMFDLHGVIMDWEGPFQKFASAQYGFTFDNVKREFYDLARDPNTPISPEQFADVFVEFVRRAQGGYGDLSPLPGIVEQIELIAQAGKVDADFLQFPLHAVVLPAAQPPASDGSSNSASAKPPPAVSA